MRCTLMFKNTLLGFSRQVVAVSLSIAIVASQSAFALPDAADFIANGGGAVDSDAGVSYNQGAGELSFSANNQQAVFGGTNGFDIANGTELTVLGGNGWNALISDISGTVSDIEGTLTNTSNMSLFLVNPAGIVFGANAQLNLGSLVASTLDISTSDFKNGQYNFFTNLASASISVDGLVAQDGATISLLSNQLDVNGDITITDGSLNLLAAESVTVSYNGGLVQFEMIEALQSSLPGKFAGINVGAGANINVSNASLLAHVGDAYSLAVNNAGVVRAVGISETEGGTIRLVGPGSFIGATGELDVDGTVSDGQVEIEAANVVLAGSTDTGQGGSLDIAIGEGSDTGLLIVSKASVMDVGSFFIEGRGTGNTIDGLQDYVVNGTDSGTASFAGVGTIDWQNVANLTAASNVAGSGAPGFDNTFEITSSGNLTGTLRGTELNDLFIVSGQVENLEGAGGNDTFRIESGVANTIDGGQDIDTLINVTNPLIDGLTGSAPEVPGGWINIQNVTPLVPSSSSTVTLSPVPSILAPTTPLFNINSLANVSLGLVGDGNNLKLPCAHMPRSTLPSEEDTLAAAEEDCVNEFTTPEYQDLLASSVYFATDKFALTNESGKRLTRVADFILDSGMFSKVVIAGHTDDVASHAYNLALSERRANSVASFLEELGVSPDLFSLHYYGETLPVKPNNSDEHRALNRRVDITLER